MINKILDKVVLMGDKELTKMLPTGTTYSFRGHIMHIGESIPFNNTLGVGFVYLHDESGRIVGQATRLTIAYYVLSGLATIIDEINN